MGGKHLIVAFEVIQAKPRRLVSMEEQAKIDCERNVASDRTLKMSNGILWISANTLAKGKMK